jgi:hypothetical protein
VLATQTPGGGGNVAINTAVKGNTPAGNPTSVSTNSDVQALHVHTVNPVTSVAVSNLPSTQPVSGTVAVSNFPATQSVSGTVGVSGTVPVSGPLTDAQLRASALPVIASLGTSAGKTNVMRTGTLVTTAVTADQVIATYTVTAGKTFYLMYLQVSARLTTFATTATNFGNASLESPAGTKLVTLLNSGAGITQGPPMDFIEPVPVAAGTVIRVVCTPGATTSFTWVVNFGGYEK